MKGYLNLPIKNSVRFLLKNQTLSDSSLPVQCTTGAPNKSSDIAFCTGTRWCYTRTKNVHLIHAGFMFTPLTPLFISAFRTKVKMFFMFFISTFVLMTLWPEPKIPLKLIESWLLKIQKWKFLAMSYHPDYKKVILVIREEKTKRRESTNNQMSLVRSGNPPPSITMSHRGQGTANLRPRLSHIQYTQTQSCIYIYAIIHVFIQ